jgi:hypothetical protein
MAEEAPSIEDLDRTERQVADLRDRIARTAEELEGRGRALFDWRLQLRKHRIAIAIGALVLGVVAATPIVIALRARARR